MKRLLFSLLFATSVIGANAQLKTPALSPTCKVSQDFSLSSIDITYSRPSMRGRKIVGDVVPYGKAWRTGANAPTKIKIGEELIIAGQKVKAGEYELYTIPGKESWEVILNTGAGAWTADGFAKENDVARFKIKPVAMEKEVQTFTIEVSDITFTTCKINLMWERTKIVLPVEANNGDNVEANIQKAINHPSIPYFQAASYYYESDKKMDLAKEYVDKALEQDPKAFYMWYLKARIERKLGNNDAAIAAARKSMETAQGAPLENEYQRNNQKIIDDINHTSRHKQDADK
jgi:tetratricopeptide (TPR) repeat protein